MSTRRSDQHFQCKAEIRRFELQYQTQQKHITKLQHQISASLPLFRKLKEEFYLKNIQFELKNEEVRLAQNNSGYVLGMLRDLANLNNQTLAPSGSAKDFDLAQGKSSFYEKLMRKVQPGEPIQIEAVSQRAKKYRSVRQLREGVQLVNSNLKSEIERFKEIKKKVRLRRDCPEHIRPESSWQDNHAQKRLDQVSRDVEERAKQLVRNNLQVQREEQLPRGPRKQHPKVTGFSLKFAEQKREKRLKSQTDRV